MDILKEASFYYWRYKTVVWDNVLKGHLVLAIIKLGNHKAG